RRARTAQALALRARIVLACADGKDNNKVAAELRVTEGAGTRWRRRVAATREETPKDATHWARTSMARRSGLSRSTIGRIWRKFDLKPHLTDGFKISTDPLSTEKVVAFVGLSHTPPDKAVVLCVDEKSQIQALARSQPVLPMMPGMPERRTHDYARNGITSLFAAFDIADGT